MTGGAVRGAVRLAELVATLSLATDLGRGEPMEHCLRQTVIALRIGERIGIGESCPTTRLHFVPDCGHMLPNQKPKWVAELIVGAVIAHAGPAA